MLQLVNCYIQVDKIQYHMLLRYFRCSHLCSCCVSFVSSNLLNITKTLIFNRHFSFVICSTTTLHCYNKWKSKCVKGSSNQNAGSGRGLPKSSQGEKHYAESNIPIWIWYAVISKTNVGEESWNALERDAALMMMTMTIVYLTCT